jgi:hypothetical protein
LGEDTLRLIANLPAPEGLADRVKAGLEAAPESGRILMWRGPLKPAGGWINGSLVRGAAAAAIVSMVAGGGWRIYSHVQSAARANVIVMPSPAAPAAAPFANAGARRVPETLDGPVLPHPLPSGSEVKVMGNLPAPPKAVRNTASSPKKKANQPRATAAVH